MHGDFRETNQTDLAHTKDRRCIKDACRRGLRSPLGGVRVEASTPLPIASAAIAVRATILSTQTVSFSTYDFFRQFLFASEKLPRTDGEGLQVIFRNCKAPGAPGLPGRPLVLQWENLKGQHVQELHKIPKELPPSEPHSP